MLLLELIHGTVVIDGGAGDKVVAADHHLEWRSTDVFSVVLDCYVILARSHWSIGHFVAVIDFSVRWWGLMLRQGRSRQRPLRVKAQQFDKVVELFGEGYIKRRLTLL